MIASSPRHVAMVLASRNDGSVFSSKNAMTQPLIHSCEIESSSATPCIPGHIRRAGKCEAGSNLDEEASKKKVWRRSV